MSDYKGAALMLPALPKARSFSLTSATTRIRSAPPSQSAASPSIVHRRKVAVPYDAVLDNQRHKIENMCPDVSKKLSAHLTPIRPLRPYYLSVKTI